MLRNSASGPEIVFPGWNSAGFSRFCAIPVVPAQVFAGRSLLGLWVWERGGKESTSCGFSAGQTLRTVS
jgi:hypothetical protein